LRVLQSDPLSAKELIEKKSAIEQSHVFNFSSSDAIAGRVARQELLRYPANYDETYLRLIANVDERAVQEVATKRWEIDNLVTVVVGDKSALHSLEQESAKENSPLFGRSIIKLGFSESIVRQ
jgi:predicted Zn-dependent peptidase